MVRQPGTDGLELRVEVVEGLNVMTRAQLVVSGHRRGLRNGNWVTRSRQCRVITATKQKGQTQSRGEPRHSVLLRAGEISERLGNHVGHRMLAPFAYSTILLEELCAVTGSSLMNEIGKRSPVNLTCS